MLQANLEELQRAGLDIERLRVSGGLSRDDFLCQSLASLAGLPVSRAPEAEATAKGVAWLASGCPPGWGSSGGEEFIPRPMPGLTARYQRFVEILAELVQ
jgi:glycerol kinase